MNPYPSYFVPEGVTSPRHTAYLAGQGMAIAAESSPGGVAGLFMGVHYDPATKDEWQQSRDGWWVLWGGQKPQQLVRLATSPRIVRWHGVEGIERGHWWRVPVLLSPDMPIDPADKRPPEDEDTYISALDRTWDGQAWSAPSELLSVQHRLLAVIHGVALGEDEDRRNAAYLGLVVELLSFGHHICMAELALRGWLSEAFPHRVVLAACDRLDLLRAPAAPAPAEG